MHVANLIGAFEQLIANRWAASVIGQPLLAEFSELFGLAIGKPGSSRRTAVPRSIGIGLQRRFDATAPPAPVPTYAAR